MKYSELKKLLKKSGCILKREGSNHEQWYSPKTGKYFMIGRHKTQEVPVGTLKSIKRDAGLE
jgi:predicted RNA binding protein YcfA (HicA-like mRNA interferase family)